MLGEGAFLASTDALLLVGGAVAVSDVVAVRAAVGSGFSGVRRVQYQSVPKAAAITTAAIHPLH